MKKLGVLCECKSGVFFRESYDHPGRSSGGCEIGRGDGEFASIGQRGTFFGALESGDFGELVNCWRGCTSLSDVNHIVVLGEGGIDGGIHQARDNRVVKGYHKELVVSQTDHFGHTVKVRSSGLEV